MSSLSQRLRELEDFATDVAAGNYPQRTLLGPGSIASKMLRSKSITSSMIDVSNLQAVSTQTGSLNVDASIVVAGGGSISMGLISPTDVINSGFWLGDDVGTPKFRLGSPSRSVVWDGSSLTIKGTIQAEDGYLKSLSVFGDLTLGNSVTDGRLLAGKASYTATTAGFAFDYNSGGNPRINIGSATAYMKWTGTAVEIKGSITADTGTLTDLTINGLLLMSGAGAIIRWSGSSNQISTSGIVTSTLDANGGTLANMTVDGTLTVGSSIVVETTGGTIRSGASSYASGTGWILEYNAGTPRMRIGTTSGNRMSWDGTTMTVRGRIEFGTSDYLENNLLHFGVTGSESSKIEMKNGTEVTYTDLSSLSSSTSGQFTLKTRGTSSRFSAISLNGGNTNGTQNVSMVVHDSTPVLRSTIVLTGDGVVSLAAYNTSSALRSQIQVGQTRVEVILQDASGAGDFRVTDSAGQVQFSVTSNGGFGTPDADTTIAGVQIGRIPWYVNGVLRYIHYYDG